MVVSPVSAKIQDNSFWAAIGKLVQGVMGGEEQMGMSEEQEQEAAVDEDFVDPREVQQVQREIKDQKKELSRMAKQAKKMTGGGDIATEISALLEQVNNFEANINAGVGLRDAIQEFRDAQIWEELNKIRARVEIPKEISRWQKDLKKVEKMLGQKKFQNLGLNLGTARSKIEETKAALSRVQEFYNSGDFESAMGEFDDLRQDFHPGEIMSVLQRMQELTNRLKSVKSQDIKAQVQELFQEVIDNFDQGEYRIARELMDESWNDIMKVISQALSVGKKKGTSKQNFIQMTDKLQEQMRNKAEEKKMKIEEMKEQKEEKTQSVQPTPETTQQPAQ